MHVDGSRSEQLVPGYRVQRALQPGVRTALGDTRVVVLLGARQVGKSTLSRQVGAELGTMATASLDETSLREAAAADPKGFLAELPRPVLIDEIQRAPDLLYEIKDAVDRDPSPGRFLLTGSANILTAPKIKEALTGRAEYLTLWPFSQAELAGATDRNFVDEVLAGEPPRIVDAPVGRAAFVEIVARGGYPEAYERDPGRRRVWYRDYLRSLIERDLRDLGDLKRIDRVPRLLRLIATQAANVYHPAGVAPKLRMDNETVDEYTALLETVFLVRRVQAWTPGLGSREGQREKIYVVDSGLMAHLLGANETRIASDDRVTGKILENFAVMEVARLVDVSASQPRQYHYRERQGRSEIDIVLESQAGEIAAIEVKAAATLHPSDWRSLAKLRDAASAAFVAGVVLYTGPETLPLSERIWAVPLSVLWAR